MLIQYKGQKEVVNLDHVSYLEKNDSDGVFYIDFYLVLARTATNDSGMTTRVISPTDPTKKKFARWVFSNESERDMVLTRLIHQSGGIAFGKTDNADEV